MGLSIQRSNSRLISAFTDAVEPEVLMIEDQQVLMVNFRQPSHEFTFIVGIDLLF
jgi:hypothetical protein